MSEILVKPFVLREIAQKLREHAQKIAVATQTVDHEVAEIPSGVFDGKRANAFRARYRTRRASMLKFNLSVRSFSKRL